MAQEYRLKNTLFVVKNTIIWPNGQIMGSFSLKSLTLQGKIPSGTKVPLI